MIDIEAVLGSTKDSQFLLALKSTMLALNDPYMMIVPHGSEPDAVGIKRGRSALINVPSRRLWMQYGEKHVQLVTHYFCIPISLSLYSYHLLALCVSLCLSVCRLQTLFSVCLYVPIMCRCELTGSWHHLLVRLSACWCDAGRS